MKLAVVADSYLHDPSTGINGTQVQNYNLASAFARQGIEVHYLAMTSDESRPDVEEYEGMSIHWLRPSGALFGYLCENRAYLRILDELRPDALYNRGRSALTFAAARWAKDNGARFVWGSNGEDSCEFFKRLDRLRRSGRPLWKKAAHLPHELLLDLLIHRGIRGAHTVINQTEHQRQRLKENYGKDGILLSSYILPPAEQHIKKGRHVLWLANLSTAKQPEVFLRLAEKCLDFNEWIFILGGGSSNKSYEETICKQAGALKNVQVLGTVPFDESFDHYRSAMLFVNTSESYADGLPNAFLQSWLHEVPVASLHHDPNNWIASYGLGFYAKGDEHALMEWVRQALADEQELREMGRRSRAFAEQEFSSQHTIYAYLRLFSREEGKISP